MMKRMDFKCKCGLSFDALLRPDGDFACPECGETMEVVRECPFGKPVEEVAAPKVSKKRAPKK